MTDPTVEFHNAVAAICSLPPGHVSDETKLQAFNDLRRACLHIKEGGGAALRAEAAHAETVLLFVVQFVEKSRLQVRRAAEICSIVLTDENWLQSFNSAAVQQGLDSRLRREDARTLRLSAPGAVLEGAEADASSTADSGGELAEEPGAAVSAAREDASATAIQWRGHWQADTGHRWDLEPDGRAICNGVFAGDAYRIVEEFSGGKQSIFRKDGWRVDEHKSTSDVLVWFKEGQEPVEWTRLQADRAPKRLLNAPGWPAGSQTPSEVIASTGLLPGAQEQALAAAEKAVIEDPEHVICQVVFELPSGWKVKKYIDAPRLSEGRGRRHLVYAPAYGYASAFAKALQQQ
mmetsp:Transcript_63533/g.151515  ORF Transcript_63533/g.151515 Transcript_63533/m.151515 type:complete len:347 (+) Transcript_63533:104-1144(+)